MITFRMLVDERYLKIGFNKRQVWCEIYRARGVSMHSLEAAYRGTRIDPDNAAKLMDWAREVHRLELDMLQLVTAPARKRAL